MTAFIISFVVTLSLYGSYKFLRSRIQARQRAKRKKAVEAILARQTAESQADKDYAAGLAAVATYDPIREFDKELAAWQASQNEKKTFTCKK